MAEDDAEAGSIIDSVILVSVRSLLEGIKFFTPDMRFSKFAPRAPSLKRSVNLLLIALKPRNISLEACCGGCDGADAIIVIRVNSRTLYGISQVT